MKCLIVEDDQVSRHLLKAQLERSPLPISTIKTATRLDEALVLQRYKCSQ